MRVLGIEGGGTKTSAALLDGSGRVLARARAGVSNSKLLTESELAAVFRTIQKQIGKFPDVVSICLAGAIASSDHKKIRTVAGKVWPKAVVHTATDRESALMAGFGKLEGIAVICGTGSSTFGMHRGKLAKSGGWGHMLGDRGSGYDIALQGMRAAIRNYDETGKVGKLASAFLQSLRFNSPEELIPWVQAASKADIAAAAVTVFRAAKNGDPLAMRILDFAANELAESVRIVAEKLHWKNPNVCLKGGVFEHQPEFFRSVRKGIRKLLPRASVHAPKYDGAVGAALLCVVGRVPPRGGEGRPTPAGGSGPTPMKDVATALTEQRNPRTLAIDKKSVAQLFDVMMNEESRTIPAIRKQKRDIVRCIETIVASFRRGGRLFYVGAGTSGRVGVLDASECPPTFSVPPDMVQGILAGGQRALYNSVEQAEDDPHAGTAAMRNHGVGKRDVVVGIAASGRTPFVLGALREASDRGAKAFFLTFNPRSAIRDPRYKTIAVATGPEVVTGSTRLKAGTATKLILNMLTTVSMIRLGKVISNLMVDVKPTNEKLRDRACRIVMALRKCTYQTAWERLEHAKWNVKKAAQTH